MTQTHRITKIEEAIFEAERFVDRAKTCIHRIKNDPFAKYQCKESAAMKRTSMDLTRALTELRKP